MKKQLENDIMRILMYFTKGMGIYPISLFVG